MSSNTSPTVHLGVGIDTARYGHHVSFLDAEKRIAAKEFHFNESHEGYQKLLRVLERLDKKHSHPHFHIRIDAAGQYAENLLQWLHQQAFRTTISVGQPARNKAYRKVHFDKRKADPVESKACARFAIVERPPATPHNPSQFQQLRDALAMMEASAKQKTRLTNQLHGLLARVFPELAVHAKHLSADWVLTLLEKYPTPQKLAAAKRESLAGIPHLKKDIAQKLKEAASKSLGSSRGEFAEQLIRQKVKAIRKEQKEFAQLGKLVEQAFEALPKGPHRRVCTVPGLGPQTSAALVAKVVSIDRFETPDALVGYFGVFPEEVDVSGTDRQGQPKCATHLRMSRKGNDLVRRLLYLAAQCAIVHNPPVREHYKRLRSQGKHYNVCIGHCMARLLHQAFAVWKQDCDFDPDAGVAKKPSDETAPGQEIGKVVGHKADGPPNKQEVTTTPSKIPSSTEASKRPLLNFAVLRQQISIVQVLEHLQWCPLSRHGAQWRGPCPLHEPDVSKSKRFAVQTEKNVYCCHSCGCEGNALDLWAAVQGLSIFDAAWSLIETFDLEPPLLN